MGLLFDAHASFSDGVQKGIDNDFARKATRESQERFNNRREAVAASHEGWQEYRQQAANIRDDVLNHLDYYLNEFITHATANGSVVHFADTAEDATRILLDICHEKNAKSVVKTKSMVSEEIHCNPTLLADGIEVNETDLGEYIIQLDDWDHPSHLIAPAMHMDQDRIYELFVKNGYCGNNEAKEMTLFARERLRQKFLSADIGITGCNFAIASTGAICMITNEGNGRMVTTLPETQVVLMGMERLLPNLSAFDAMMQVFVRSAVGTKVSSYLSISNGPRAEDAQDGPKEMHIIIIDNGRSKMLASRFKPMLRCIRCGTCQNMCPVFRHITGHGYGACYQGPMGVVYTPLLHGFDNFTKNLPYACTLCGACSEHCPVKIPLHELILAERQEITEYECMDSAVERAIFRGAGAVLGFGASYHVGTRLGNTATKMAARFFGSGNCLNDSAALPVLKGWTASRNMPMMRAGEFRRWWKQHQKEGHQ